MAPTLISDFDSQRKRTAIIGWSLAALLGLAAIFFGLKAFGFLGKQGSQAGEALSAVGTAPKSMLQKQGDQPPPAISKIGERKEMPKDVEDWLKHLERIENLKVELSGNQMAEVSVLMAKFSTLGPHMGLMNPYDQSEGSDSDQEPSGYAKGKILDFKPGWEKLIADFQSYPPPQECLPIAQDYNTALGEVSGAMGDLAEVLTSAAQDPTQALQAVKKMQDSSYADIDRYFARTDEKVRQICDKYEKRKWFSVKSDVLPGGMMGRFAPR